MSKRWIEPEPVSESAEARLTGFRPVERQILVRRGLKDAARTTAFFGPLEGETHDPSMLAGMDEAVDRLIMARERGEAVVVYGDYDVDGIAATALLVKSLAECGLECRHFLPSRFEEGYGLRIEALDRLQAEGAKLVVTVDCGIRSVEEVAAAGERGLDVIITDHHHPGPVLPPARATICPRTPQGAYPFEGLAGVGVAYKLAQALALRLKRPPPDHYLDLVALGTVGDLAPLIDENRVLAARGLARINESGSEPRHARVGLNALVAKAGLVPGRVTAQGVGFGLAPRLNAAGRLESPEAAYRLLMTADPSEAAELATELDQGNRKRQSLTLRTLEQARAIAYGEREGALPPLLFAADAGFSEGIVGLAAARLVDEFYRPAVVGVEGEGLIRASARSIPEFHITEALEACADLLEMYGGHARAAGLTIRVEKAPALVARLQALAAQALEARDPMARLELDALADLGDMDYAMLEFVEHFEPCGEGNPPPLFGVLGAQVVEARAVGSQRKHLKLTLRSGNWAMDAIAFGQGDWHGRLPPRVDVAAHLERNRYMGVESLQLNVQDLRPSSWAR